MAKIMIINTTPNPYVLNGEWIWAYQNAEYFQMGAFDPRRTILIVPKDKHKMMSNPKHEFKQVIAAD